MLRGWVLRKGVPFKKLRIELAKWAELMSNGSPPFTLYRAMNHNRVLPADKKPGVRPLIVGEIMMQLISVCIIKQVGPQATTACGNTQPCAGTRAGIKGNLHAVRAIWPQSSGWTIDENGIPQQMGNPLNTQPDGEFLADPNAGTLRAAANPTSDEGADPDSTRSRSEENVGFGQANFDDENAFGSANRVLILWNVGH